MLYILSSTPVKGATLMPVIEQRFFKKAIDFLSYDYLLFTSKNAVIAAERISDEWKRIPAIVIGNATAAKVEELGGRVAFVSTSFYGERLAKEISERFDPKRRYLFLRPKAVATDIADILEKKGFHIDEQVVYETRCVECQRVQAPPRGSIIIFSSPSTVRCFFRCFAWDESYRAYALGTKTAAALPEGIECRICEGNTLQECIDLILSQ